MADKKPPVLKPYDPIPPALPDTPDPKQREQDNAGMRQAMLSQFGTATGRTMKDLNGNVWNVRNTGDPKNPTETYIRKDPADPTRFIVWPKGGEQQPGVKPGGMYYDQVQALRNELNANGGENPLTGKRWGVDPGTADPSTADYGTLRSMQQILHRSTFQPVGSADIQALNTANDVRGLLKDVEDQYQAAGGKAGLNKWTQMVQGLKTKTDIANFASDTQDPSRAAYLTLMRDLSQLKEAGANITQLSKDGASGAILEGLNGVLQEGGILHPLLSALGSGVVGGLNAVKNGDFDNDALRYLTPLARARTDRLIYGTVSNMAQPAAKTLVKQDVRQMGTDAADDLMGLGVGNGMDVAKVRPLPEPEQPQTQEPEQTPTPTPAPSPSIPGAQSPTPKATPTPAPENLGAKIRKNDVVGNLLNQGWNAVQNWGKDEINPKAGPPPAPIQQQTPPQPKPSVTPSPSPSPTPKPNNLWLQNSLYSGGDQGESGSGNLADIPSLEHQEHVDALEPGTPFRWSDGETYVKT